MTHIFVNFPTSDVSRAKKFYTALGATVEPLFSSDHVVCLKWDENVFLMALSHDTFARFTDKPIADPAATIQTIVTLSRESRADVDNTVAAGLASGGTEPRDAQDLGFLYSRDLEDPDGNLLKFNYLEPIAATEGPDAFLSEARASATR